MQVLAWEHASPSVTELTTLLVTMSDFRQQCFEVSLRGILSLADTIVLVHRLGPLNAAHVVTVVDPWCYPGELERTHLSIRQYMQSEVDKASNAGKVFGTWTEQSMISYLLSPLLLQKGKRPILMSIRKAAALASCRSAFTHVTDDDLAGVVLNHSLTKSASSAGFLSFYSYFYFC